MPSDLQLSMRRLPQVLRCTASQQYAGTDDGRGFRKVKSGRVVDGSTRCCEEVQKSEM